MTDHEHSHRSAKCLGLAERLSEYLDDELPERLRREIEAHLHDCSKCDRFLTSLARTKELAHLIPGPALSKDRLRQLAAKVRRRMDEKP